MKAYGSLTNRIMECVGSEQPYVGMGATELMWSDRHAYTVVKIKSKNRILVTRDIAKRVDNNGMSECQTYEYTQDKDAEPVELIKTKRGWKMLGCDRRFMLGRRDEYFDYSF